MMNDLMEPLRDKSFWYTPHIADGRPMRHIIAEKAADEIERLRAIEVAAQSVVKCEFKDIDSCVDAKEAASLFMLAHALANKES